MNVHEAGLALADPEIHTDPGRLHDALRLLRREAPVHWVEPPGYAPFWAITRHADIKAIERDHRRFTNAPRPILSPLAVELAQLEMAQIGLAVRTVVHLDGQDHRALRSIAAGWFGPAAMRRLEARATGLARSYVGKMADLGGECDFAREISADLPLHVLLTMLGLPEEDFGPVRALTQALFGTPDPDEPQEDGPVAIAAMMRVMFAYFDTVTEDRRAKPTGDLASAIANARVDGQYLSDVETRSYYLVLAAAGHDTASAVLAGGIQALAQNPVEFQRLKENPGLVPAAVDEMLRWVTPVTSFMRTATEDCTVRGVDVKAGQSVLLSYPSANRDEEVFEEPFRFDAGRSPNDHLSFGAGVHHCLGAPLAGMEIRAFLTELLSRVDSLEPAGDPVLGATNFVGGLKRLPLRYKITG